jgi:hypothetical protein
MSVDDRLREAFGETDRSWDEQVPDALAAVTARRRHESVVRRGAAAALVAAAAVAAAVVATPDDGRESPAPPLTTPSASQDVGTPNGPLEGTWTSDEITAEDVRAAARDAGRPGIAAAMLDVLPPRPFHVVLLITGTGLNQGFRSSAGETSADDVETILIEGSRVFLRPLNAPGGVNEHTWALEDGVLRLTFVSTTEADTRGVPGEAWQRLLYDTSAFTKVS